MTPIKYADGSYAKSCKTAEVYNKSALKDFSIEGVDAAICHSLQKNWSSSTQANLIDIAFEVQSPLAIRNRSVKTPQARNQNTFAKQFGNKSRHYKTANVVELGSTTSPSRTFQHDWTSRSSPISPSLMSVLASNAPTSSFTQPDAASFSSTLPSFATSPCAVCYDPTHSKLGCPLFPKDALPVMSAVWEGHLRKRSSGNRTQCPPSRNPRLNNDKRFYNNLNPSSSFGRVLKVLRTAFNALLSAKI